MQRHEAARTALAGGAVLLVAGALAFAQSPASSVEPPVALIDGKPVLASELLEASQGQILNLRKQEYDVKRRALDAVIEKKLLEAEAARRGVTVNDLTQKEIYRKVGESTDAEVELFYLARQDASQRRFEEVRDQMRNALLLAKRNAAREAFMANLRAQRGVEILLEAPRVEVGFDPARLNGPRDAPVRIVEFSDFECPYCRSAEKTVQGLLAKYPGKVNLAYRDFPLTGIHSAAQRAAEASRCAADQGRFWPYHDRLLASNSLEVAQLKEHAKGLGLNQGRFDSCLDTGRMRAAVDGDAQQGRLVGVVATPAFFINGIPLSGAQPAAAFEKIIEDELMKEGKRNTALR